jgi:hypothetical protein
LFGLLCAWRRVRIFRQQILVQLLAFQLMKSLGAVLLRFLVVDLVPSVFMLQKKLAYLVDLQQVEFVRSADQPMKLIAANSTSLK